MSSYILIILLKIFINIYNIILFLTLATSILVPPFWVLDVSLSSSTLDLFESREINKEGKKINTKKWGKKENKKEMVSFTMLLCLNGKKIEKK